MTTLFNLQDYEVIAPRPIDPYWNEIILDCSGRVESDGQVTLFYDASDEPPDPDDFQDHVDFEVAWTDWEKQHPDFKPDMSPFPEQIDDDFIDVTEELVVQSVTLPEQNNSVLEDYRWSSSEQLAQWTEQYFVTRSGKRHWYYRYCYYYFGKIHHIHIPGGNSNSVIANQRLEMVKNAIAAQASSFQIQNLIRGGFQN
jgi:hypothetical protein